MTSTSNQIDYSKLFKFNDPLANQPLRLSPKQDCIHSDEVGKLFCGEWQPLEPIVLKAVIGGAPFDFLWTTFPPLVCISQRVVDLLLDNRFTGWVVYPVEVYGRKGEPIHGYHGFAVKSYAGEQDLSRSQIITKQPTIGVGRAYDVYNRLYFDESKWDGSDIFRVYYARKIMTHRIRAVFKKAKVTNVRFTPLTEYELDVSSA